MKNELDIYKQITSVRKYMYHVVLYFMQLICFRYEYFWADGVQYKKPTKLPAPQYVSLLMDWIDSKINDEEVFPSTTGADTN